MKKVWSHFQFLLQEITPNRRKVSYLIAFLLIGLYSCTHDRTVSSDDFEKDTDGDGVTDQEEVLNGTNKNNPCDPIHNAGYSAYDPLNILWSVADCDNDGILNSEEVANDSDPYINESLDSDGDGIVDYIEIENGTNENNPCDPFQSSDYIGFNSLNTNWLAADCDGDGITNGDELINSTNPYFDEIGGIDTDGDGIKDARETLDGTDINNPCDPAQPEGYNGYDASNIIWSAVDCDGDGVINGDEITNATDPYYDNRVYAVPEFLSTLSQLKLFQGDISDLNFNETVYEYSLSTPVFSDYAYMLRSVAIPRGNQMTYSGEGLFNFPDNTILTQTMYYLNDERNPSLGKKIIETRVLIKLNGVWNTGKYLWNDTQTEALYDEDMHSIQVDWIDNTGTDKSVSYRALSNNFCVQCHDNNGTTIPIGPKARALNNVHNGMNQIQRFVDNGLLTGAPDVLQIEVLPDWSDNLQTLEDRARAYLDINCSHCHQPGGSHNINYDAEFDFRYETSFTDSKINEAKTPIIDRMSSQISGYFMPLIGSTVIHTEGLELIDAYIDSLE